MPKKLLPRLQKPQFETVEEAIAFANTRRQQKLNSWQTRYTLADGVRVFRESWAILVRQHFPDTPVTPISPTRDVPRVKRGIVTPLRDANLSVSDFVRFTIEQWALIRQSKQFRNFKAYPEVPALAWFLKFSDLYIGVFVDYGEFKNTIFESPVEQKQQEREKQKQESVSKVVKVARDEIRKKESEIARLRAENKRLQSSTPSAIRKRRSAKSSQLPDWK